MQIFQFQLSNDFLKVPVQQPFFIEPKYSTDGNKVELMDMGVPPFMFPYLKDTYGLHDAVYHAAENNHASNQAAQAEQQHDVFATIYDHFKIPAL